MSKILVHDWSGHPFQIGLSRELARRGHQVQHAYFVGGQGPKGPMARQVTDPDNFTIVPRTIDGEFSKYGFARRWMQEQGYARAMAQFIRQERPEVVLSSNTPLDIQSALLRATHASSGAFVFWLQDVLSVGMGAILRKRLGPAGGLVAQYYDAMERSTMRRSEHIVCICDEFSELLERWAIPPSKRTVIENWASREEIRPMPKDNVWSRAQGVADKTVFLYAGTLGLKHDPSILLKLAETFAADPNVSVVVASEGLGADWLREHATPQSAPGLKLLPFQPYEDLPAMLASADVMLGVIEPDAAGYSVPSKVLSYLAAGRPVLMSVPESNAITRLVHSADAGITVAPGDAPAFLKAAARLKDDQALRTRLAANARQCAEERFDVSKIADRFEAVFVKALAERS